MPKSEKTLLQPTADGAKQSGGSGNELEFIFEAHQVRVELIEGEPWFMAQDVCRCLGLDHLNMALAPLDDDEKLTATMLLSGQRRKVIFVNESGLWSLVFRSRKSEAKAFRKWVTGVVLPSIRKHGMYCKVFSELTVYDVAGEGMYRYCDVLTALGRSKSGSAYKVAERYRADFKYIAGFVFVSKAYAMIMVLRKRANLLLKQVKERQAQLFPQPTADTSIVNASTPTV
ncbi:hypothetical protein EBZ39_03550 [bacterium]|nr:hypothetical protein [bacterium]